MKDFIFTDPSESDSSVIFRTDLIGNNENFTVHQITGLDNVPVYHQKKVKLLKEYNRLPYNKTAFIQFATANGLDLVIQDTNGENRTILVDYNSDWASDSW